MLLRQVLRATILFKSKASYIMDGDSPALNIMENVIKRPAPFQFLIV